jgi:hypothetical protein
MLWQMISYKFMCGEWIPPTTTTIKKKKKKKKNTLAFSVLPSEGGTSLPPHFPV